MQSNFILHISSSYFLSPLTSYLMLLLISHLAYSSFCLYLFSQFKFLLTNFLSFTYFYYLHIAFLFFFYFMFILLLILFFISILVFTFTFILLNISFPLSCFFLFILVFNFSYTPTELFLFFHCVDFFSFYDQKEGNLLTHKYVYFFCIYSKFSRLLLIHSLTPKLFLH